MKTTHRRLLVALLLLCSTAIAQHAQHVNPFIGTDAHGHTFPGATLPFGMVQLSPDTRVEGWDACAGYHYSDSAIIGFSHTHLSGTGIPDYGDILLMPTVGMLRVMPGDEKTPVKGYRSRFHHEKEKAIPGYYSVWLDDYRIQVELTASRRVGFHRYLFPQSDSANIIIDLKHGLGPDRVIESELRFVSNTEIAGMRRSDGWAKDQRVYFVAQFSKPFAAFGVAEDDSIKSDLRQADGKNVKGYVRFSTKRNDAVLVKVGLSAVSIEGARRNIEAEISGWDFDRVKADAQAAWNQELNKIKVEGGTPEQLTTFYTAFYHALLAPNLFCDTDGSYRGMDGKIHQSKDFEMHTVFSLWDTFRAEHPLLSIIDQKRTIDFIKSLLARYDEGGVLPVWELAADETWCMIGYHSIPVIVDAHLKGIRGFEVESAYQAMKHSASLDHFGLASYREYGYIPAEKEAESVSKTLEYAYDDWCIAQMARRLGKAADYDDFIRRAQYFKNIFDLSTGFMRAKVNGGWAKPFDPTAVTNHYTEANAWQYSFFAPHDIDGLINMLGGSEKFIQKLDQLFTGDSQMTGRQQADITGMIGQYAQGNEPSHHVAYLYNYAGAPWKTQARVRQIMDGLYTAKPDGLCGNDDCGQMSAWYVMSAMGFYQVTPGLPLYCLGSPLFDKVTLNLENGKTFVVIARHNSEKNPYIQSATLNAQPYAKSFLTHDDMMQGGELVFEMGSLPNESWAARDDDSPHTPPMPPFVTVPYVIAAGKTFVDSTQVALNCNTTGAEIYFTLDGTNPSTASAKYSSPLMLRTTTIIKALALKSGAGESKTITADFLKWQPVGRISLKTPYSFQYTGGGDNALLDGIRGAEDFRIGAWQGYEQHDLEAVIDLGERKQIEHVSLGCLQDNNSWIFFPQSVIFSFSDDGSNYHEVFVVPNDVAPQEMQVMIKEFHAPVYHFSARYVRVIAKNMGLCPDWHKGAGNKAWLFVDEIRINAK